MLRACQRIRSIRSWDDLKEYGIRYLTGEACGMSMRLLCDVTSRGRGLIEGFLSAKLVDGSNWNGGSADDPHVASVMLTRAVFNDLAAYILVFTSDRRGETNVAAFKDGGALEYIPSASGLPVSMLGRHYARSTAPGTGLRNQHAMSGRVA